MGTPKMMFVNGLLIAAAACQPPADGATFTEADRTSAAALTDQWTAAVVAGDLEAAANLYTEDTHFMPPNQRPVHGREAVLEWFKGLPPVAEVTTVNGRVEGSGDVAYVYGTYTLRFDMEGAPTDSGSYFDVRVRQPDGSWKYAVDMFHSDLPLPGAE